MSRRAARNYIEGPPCKLGHTTRYAAGRQACVECNAREGAHRYAAQKVLAVGKREYYGRPRRPLYLSEEEGLRETLRRWLKYPAPDVAPTGEDQWIA